jgi:hypothetical protein
MKEIAHFRLCCHDRQPKEKGLPMRLRTISLALLACLGATVPAAPPADEARPPAQSQTPTAHAHITDAAFGDTPTGGPRQAAPASVARNAASLRPHAADQPRAARAVHERHTRRRKAPLRRATLRPLITARGGTEASPRPLHVARARVMGAHRPGQWPVARPAPQPRGWQVAPDSAPEVERPWNRRIVNDTGV